MTACTAHAACTTPSFYYPQNTALIYATYPLTQPPCYNIPDWMSLTLQVPRPDYDLQYAARCQPQLDV